MGLLEMIGGTMSSTVKKVIDKNRKTALMNRVRIVIRTEEQNTEKAYIALGKYYYKHLRDETNGDTEIYCVAADHANRRLSRAVTRLEELSAAETVAEGEVNLEEFFVEPIEEPLEESWEPMSELKAEEDLLDGDALEELEKQESAEKIPESQAEAPKEETADGSEDEVIPWA